MTSHRTALLPLVALAAAGLIGCGGEPAATTGDEQFNTEGPPLQYQEYEVLFTNPDCGLYEYDTEVRSEAGDELTAKPKDVFCTYDDIPASASRPSSPQNKLISWIDDPDTKEVFFTALSFSNYNLKDALCDAVQERGLKVTFVLDSGTNTARANDLLACDESGDLVRFEKRGHTEGIGYAHNKLFMVNPGAETMKIAFGSGNMSSGVVLHHENWHFITLSSETYFAQAHLCLMNAELDAWQSKDEYRSSIEACLDEIEAKEERDIQAYFVPADRYKASERFIDAIYDSWGVDIAAHRFTYSSMMRALKDVLDWYELPMRMVADDDMYWAGRDQQVGDNMAFEYYNTESLVDRGAEVRWMETNHDSHLLHHNKFMIFDMNGHQPDAVWCGAGNLTGTAFSKNWENFYYVTIPQVVDAYRAQYEHMWNNLATQPQDMPTENVMPPTD